MVLLALARGELFQTPQVSRNGSRAVGPRDGGGDRKAFAGGEYGLCVVWQLARSEHPQADEARRFLVQLSGRQMARGKRFTEPALLAGLWMFLTMIHTLDSYDLETLSRIANVVLPNPRAGPASELV
jgi:hypothetical protein